MAITPGKVRRCALNLIYALLESGEDIDTFDKELFWSMALEKDTDHYRTALAKALLHAARNSGDSERLLLERSHTTEEAMEGDLTTAALREDISRYARQSAAFESAVEDLRLSLGDKRRDGTAPLAELSEQVLHAAKATLGLGAELLPALEDATPYRRETESYAALLRRRARMLESVAALSEPLNLPEQREIAGLQRLGHEMEELRPLTEELAESVFAKRADYDALLEGLLAHYSTERLDTVDKIILYISLHELRETKLPIAVVVSEATALANEYSGAKSAPFIHGLISAAARG